MTEQNEIIENCVHEAGHCLLAWKHNYKIAIASVVPQANGRVGWISVSTRDTSSLPSVLLAGPIAESQFRGIDIPTRFDTFEFRDLSDVCKSLDIHPKTIGQFWSDRRVAAILDSVEQCIGEHWQIVTAIAEHLRERQTIGGWELEPFFAAVA
jgi:hypothetical protein